MVLCCAKNCSGRSGLCLLKRFPHDPQLQARWIANIGRPDYKFSVNSYVCEAHFTPDQWTDGDQKTKFKKDAVPSIFCNCPKRRALQDVNADSADQDHGYSKSSELGNKLKTANKRRSNGAVVVDHEYSIPENFSKISKPMLLNERSSAVVDHEYCVTTKSSKKSKHAVNKENDAAFVDHGYSQSTTSSKTSKTVNKNENNADTKIPKRKRGRPAKESDIIHLNSCPMKKKYCEHNYCVSVESVENENNCHQPVSVRDALEVDDNSTENETYGLKHVSSRTENQVELEVSPGSLLHNPSEEVEKVADTSDNSIPVVKDRDHSLMAEQSAEVGVSCEELISFSQDDILSSTVIGPNEVVNISDLTAFSGPVELPPQNPSDLNTATNNQFLEQIMNENKKLKEALRSEQREKKEWKVKFRRLQEKFNNICLHTSKRFGQDQLDALSRGGSLRGTAWSKETIMKALRIHFASRTAGYELTSSTQMPLPSVRVLRDSIKHIKFRPGVLHEIFQLLPAKVKNMDSLEKECMLAFDEMSIRQATEFDATTNTYIGNCTLPIKKPQLTDEQKVLLNNNPTLIEEEDLKLRQGFLKQKATKAMTFILGGVTRRWKQTIAFHFTGNSFCGRAVKDEIVQILKKCHAIGLKVRVIVSDMGSRQVWTAFGINVGPYTDKVWIVHPADPTMRLYLMPDTVHVFKNIVEMLRSNKLFLIADRFVQEFQLPSNCVELEHLRILCKYQENMRWKLAPGLSEDLLKINHFKKMKVGNATKLFNRRNAAALMYLSFLPEGTPGMRTTAWFINLVCRWFNIVTARSPVRGLGKKNMNAFAVEIRCLVLTMDVFQGMVVGNEWKPAQTGVKAATKCILDLAALYLDEVGLDFLLCGRLTTDICENCFSMIRCVVPKPSAYQFKLRLRTCTICQFMKHVPKSSYYMDDRSELIDFLHAENLTVPEDVGALSAIINDEEEEAILACLSENMASGLKSIPEKEKCVFYRVCGYIIHQMQLENPVFRECSTCLHVCRHTSPTPHKYSELLRCTEFKEGALFEVSDAVFNLILNVEEKVMAVEDFLIEYKGDVLKFLEKEVCVEALPLSSPLNVPCHNISALIIHRYLRMRVKLMSDKPTEVKQSKAAASQLSSFSMGSRYLADRFNPSTKK